MLHDIFLIPLSALLFNTLTWGYIFAKRRKSPVNRAYLILSLWVSVWLFQNLILWLPTHKLWFGILIFLNPLFWIPIGLLFLNFVYAYLDKRPDYFYSLVLFFTLCAAVISLTTSLIGSGYKLQPWGPLPLSGLLYGPSVVLALIMPCIYAICLLYCRLTTCDPNQRKQLILIIMGALSGLSVGCVTDVILPHVFKVRVIPLGSASCAILSIFVFFAVIRYRFLVFNIEDIADDIFANMQDGIVILKAENSIIQMNQSAQELFNFETNNFSETRISTFIDNYSYAENYIDFETYLHQARDKSVKVVLLSQSAISLANHKTAKILIIRDITAYHQAIVDLHKHHSQLEELVNERTLELTVINQQLVKEVTERKQQESELQKQEQLLQTAVTGLRESEERYRTLADNTFDLICEISQFGILLYTSPNFKEILGYDPEELIGQRCTNLLHPEELHHLKLAFSRIVQKRDSFQTIHRVRHRNGDWLWVESAGKSYCSLHDGIKVVITARDITNRKKIEAEMIKANKFESIAILAGGLAHDFNNILSVLWGNITMARTYGILDSRVDERLAKAENALGRARDLTRQLLIFARGIEPQKEAVSIAELLLESINLTLLRSNIQATLNCPDDLWLVEVDAGQMNQVFTNLLINAQQAMPGDGNIVITAHNIKVKAGDELPLTNGNYVEISFVDQGEGISEENLAKIFDPYFTTKPKGTGLGLATVYSIMQKHKGHISVESKPAVGTTVHLYIPASKNQDPNRPLKFAKVKFIVGHGRVLVIENEFELREVLAKMLGRIGYEVEVTGTEADAIELFQQAQQHQKAFSLVIMDLLIPWEPEGFDAIKRLLQIDSQIKVIVCSGYSKDLIISNFKHYGFCGVLTKPYTMEELMAVLESCS
ncbi:MAG TPA: hypothetical protein DDW65_22535 [Firmicutes bacterium]|nr:hypothetical protein [Bacillota bacterium]